MTDFILLDSKITADGDSSREIKRCLLLIRKTIINLNGVLKSRDIALPTKVPIIKVMVFPRVRCTDVRVGPKRRLSTKELMLSNCSAGRRFLRVPWTGRKSSQWILKEINAEHSLEELMLKLQSFGHLCKKTPHWKRPQCWERSRARGERGSREWGIVR